MLSRKIDRIIEDHFAYSGKALFLTGCRQSGKTYAIRKFASQHGYGLVEMNFLLQPETVELFSGAGDVKELLLRISAYSDIPLVPGKTVIFFDEIEEYADVMTWVKALVDEGSYLYALSGSLLGIELKNIRSLPVGYLSEYRLYPMDFEEFALAVGLPQNVILHLHESYRDLNPVDEYIHAKAMQVYRLYLLVGGMPAAVQKYVDTNNMRLVAEEQKAILSLYKRDIARYDNGTGGKKLYINEVFDLIPSELNSKNKRFILKRLNEHMTFSRHENDFIWLKEADMALPTFNVDTPTVPLKLAEQRNLFKLFQNDVGLLASQYSGGIQIKILQGDSDINYGAIYENAVAQELHAHGWPLYYFNSKKTGELDFLLEDGEHLIPVEVKSGKNYERHRALSNIMNARNYKFKKAYILCNDNVHSDGKMIYLPVYMTMFIRCTEAAQGIIYRIDFSGLKST